MVSDLVTSLLSYLTGPVSVGLAERRPQEPPITHRSRSWPSCRRGHSCYLAANGRGDEVAASSSKAAAAIASQTKCKLA